MSVSICLLTRDADKSLGQLLTSVAPLGAEILVGDTGSHDGTVALARERGATVVDVAWRDDFGAAQNQVLDRATGDWILWLNPDEELVSQGKTPLAALLALPTCLAYVVRIQEVTTPSQAGRSVVTLYPRLFRRRPDLRFVGRLHPHFNPPLEELARREGLELRQSDLLLRRHAYLSVPTPDKLRWATRLLELELAERPGQLHYQIEYGRNLLRLNDPRGHAVLGEAADQVLAARDSATAPTPTVASLLEYLITVSPLQSFSHLTPEQAGELALRWFPNSPPLLWLLAERAFQATEFRAAIDLLEKLVQLGRTGKYDATLAFDDAVMREPALLNLARSYLRVGDLDRAELVFAQLFASPTHAAQGREGYAQVQALRRSASGAK